MQDMNVQFPLDTLEQYMKRAGISHGYIDKPCLDPRDPLCPDTAPNKKSQQVMEIIFHTEQCSVIKYLLS